MTSARGQNSFVKRQGLDFLCEPFRLVMAVLASQKEETSFAIWYSRDVREPFHRFSSHSKKSSWRKPLNLGHKALKGSLFLAYVFSLQSSFKKLTCTSIEACLFKHPFYRGSHSKGIKERALHVHQRKTKHFIAKLFAQPYMLLNTFSILVIDVHVSMYLNW